MFMGLRHTEIHTQEPLLFEPSVSEVEMAIENLKRHKSPGIEQIPAKLIQTGSRTIHSESHKIIFFFLKSGRIRSLYLFIGRVIKETVVIVEHITFVSYIKNFIQHRTVRLTP
jgi:hypothetical protein